MGIDVCAESCYENIKGILLDKFPLSGSYPNNLYFMSFTNKMTCIKRINLDNHNKQHGKIISDINCEHFSSNNKMSFVLLITIVNNINSVNNHGIEKINANNA